MKAKDFLTEEQQSALISAIKEAEKNTSGEIRIHLDDTCREDPIKRAEKVFRYLGMDRTAQRNGVLIYLACESRVFAIIGDKGINDRVPEGFWNDVKDAMATDFRAGNFTVGMEKAIVAVGEKLKAFFPYQKDDVNELPDEISYEDNQNDS